MVRSATHTLPSPRVTALLVVRGLAERQIVDIRDWYAEQADGLDRDFGTELDHAFATIAGMPRIGQPSEHGRRRLALKRFPYLIWYTVHDEANVVRVLAITHQSRGPRATT